MDDKRPRTGPCDIDSDESCSTPNSPRQSASHYPPVGAMDINNMNNNNGSMVAMAGRLGPLQGPYGNRHVGISAPLTADSLSGLVGFIAPSLSDGGGSASSVSGSCMETTPYYPPVAAPFSCPREPSTFLREGTSPPHHGGGGGRVPMPSMTLPSSNTALPNGQAGPSAEGSAPQKQGGFQRSEHPLLSANSDPMFDLRLPARDLQPRTKSASAITMAASGDNSFAESSQQGEYLGSGGGQWMGERGGGGEVQYSGGQQQQQQKRLHDRGSLPMILAPRPKAHLRVFMRSMGSVVLLPGAEALREASRLDIGNEEEENGGDNSSSGVSGSPARNGSKRYDPMDETEDDGGSNRHAGQRIAGGGAGGVGGRGGRRSGSSGEEEGGDNDDDDDVVNVLAEACKAEAWAAVAVGALFSGAGNEEAKGYVARSMQALSRCLDAPLPEV